MYFFSVYLSREQLYLLYVGGAVVTVLLLLAVAVAVRWCCNTYTCPGCPRYVGTWVQSPGHAEHVRLILQQYIRLPLLWRPQRIRPRNRQVIYLYYTYLKLAAVSVESVASVFYIYGFLLACLNVVEVLS